jgi:hypothetical protein
MLQAVNFQKLRKLPSSGENAPHTTIMKAWTKKPKGTQSRNDNRFVVTKIPKPYPSATGINKEIKATTPIF